MVVCRFPVDQGPHQQLVVINVHLSAFDSGAELRIRQLKAVLKLAVSEYESGHYVLVGGDWNLRLGETQFAHETAPEHLFWLADLPIDLIPATWTVAVDRTVPTVRTVHKEFIKGENYTCVIDGFVLSPNITLVEVANLDLRFAYSDHNPVHIRIRFDDR